MTAVQPDAITLSRLQTPIGEALLAVDETGALRIFDWTDRDAHVRGWLARRYPAATISEGETPVPVRQAVEAYFAGDIHALDALPRAAAGTAFQRSVWDALVAIPAGETLSYAGIAQRIGKPTAMRAVGLANGANPLAIIVPCHRVIGADGTLTGYAGGLERKRWLLAHEAAARRGRAAA